LPRSIHNKLMFSFFESRITLFCIKKYNDKNLTLIIYMYNQNNFKNKFINVDKE